MYKKGIEREEKGMREKLRDVMRDMVENGNRCAFEVVYVTDKGLLVPLHLCFCR